MASGGEGIESYNEEQRRLLNRFRGISKKKIRENYRLVKNLIAPDTISNELLAQGIFTQEQYRFVQQNRNTDCKRHNLLKHVLRLSEHNCFRFFEILHKQIGERDLEAIFSAAGKAIPENIIVNHNIQEHIISSRTTLVPQLEVYSTADCLLEYSVITLEEHDHILEQENRQAQREKIFEIILSKTDWVNSFVHILIKTEQQQLLKSEPQAETNLDFLYQTQIGNTVAADDIVIRLTGSQSFEESIMRNMNDEAEVIEECERNGILEIYSGNSIYIFLPFSSNNLNLDNKSAIQKKMLELLKLVSRNCSSYSVIPIQQNITVEVLRKPHDSFLNEHYGIPKSTKTHGDNECIRCLSEMVRKNADVILSEIERDIIEETFSSATYVSTFAKNACLDKNVTRTTRAKRFILYILQHEDALRSFIDVYREKSTVNLKPELCKGCSTSSTSVAEYHQVEQIPLVAEFKFIISIEKSDLTIKPVQTIPGNGAYNLLKQLTPFVISAPKQDLLAVSSAISPYGLKDKRKKKLARAGIDNQSTVKKKRQSSTL